MNKKHRRTCDECGCMDMVNIISVDGYRRWICDECLPGWVHPSYYREKRVEEEETQECNF
jgi:hypothetical protein